MPTVASLFACNNFPQWRIITPAAYAVAAAWTVARYAIAPLKQRCLLLGERLRMLDRLQRLGSVRLKVLLLAACIAAAMVAIYLQTRPPQSARLAPDYTPSFGRHAARNADRSLESSSPRPERRGDP